MNTTTYLPTQRVSLDLLAGFLADGRYVNILVGGRAARVVSCTRLSGVTWTVTWETGLGRRCSSKWFGMIVVGFPDGYRDDFELVTGVDLPQAAQLLNLIGCPA